MKNRIITATISTIALFFTPIAQSMQPSTKNGLFQKHSSTLAAQMKALEKPGETIVPMWGADSIVSNSTDKDTKTISTLGLGGCNATAMIIKCDHAEQYAAMTHYPPSEENRNHQYNVRTLFLKGLATCLQKTTNGDSKSIRSAHFFAAVPGEYEQETLGGKWKLVPDRNQCRKFQQVIQNAADEHKVPVETTCLPYDMMAFDFLRHEKLRHEKLRDFEIILKGDAATVILNKDEYYKKTL
jgi:hypothetical protein